MARLPDFHLGSDDLCAYGASALPNTPPSLIFCGNTTRKIQVLEKFRERKEKSGVNRVPLLSFTHKAHCKLRAAVVSIFNKGGGLSSHSFAHCVVQVF